MTEEEVYEGTVVRWVDGDTVEVFAWQDEVVGETESFGVTHQQIHRAIEQKIYRLTVVNTPETGKPGYREATAYCNEVAPPGSRVRLTTHGDDNGGFGRTLANVFPGDSRDSMSERILRDGFGVPYVKK